MKILWSIIAIYFVSLTFMQVCADSDHEDEQVQVIGDEPCPDEDQCTPFCQCNCCRVNIFQPNMVVQPHPPAGGSIQFSTYVTPNVDDVFTDFWQPPKLG